MYAYRLFTTCTMPITAILLAMCLCLITNTVTAAPESQTTSPLQNGDFEQGTQHWYFSAANKAKATATIDKQTVHSGKMSIRLANETDRSPNVFGTFYQTLNNLSPMTQYRLTFWCKAENIKYAWIGGGPKWDIRKQLPDGTYDWKQLELTFQTGLEETQFILRINVDGITESLWIDTMTLEAIGPGKFSVSAPKVSNDIPAKAAFFPAFQGKIDTPATVLLRDDNDPKLGANIRMNWDAQGLNLNINVLDPSRDVIQSGQSMWTSDSVQLGLETQLDQAKSAYSGTSVELGLTVDSNNNLHQYAWHPTSFLTNTPLQGTGHVHHDGYDITVTIPWSILNLPNGKRPDVMGINVVINDGNNGKRRVVAWTDGITQSKQPARFAQVHLLESDTHAAYAVVLDGGANAAKDVKKDLVFGHILSFAPRTINAQQVSLIARMTKGDTHTTLCKVESPNLQAGQSSMTDFAVAAGQLPGLGAAQFRLNAAPNNQNVAVSMPLSINDYENSLKNQLQSLTDNLNAFNEALAKHPQLAKDAQLNLGRHIVERFAKRVADNKQSLRWNLLQLDEAAIVLKQTQARLTQLVDHPEALFTMDIPIGEITHRDGLLWAKDNGKEHPVFLYGYGHFAQVVRDLPNMNTLGATVIQRERGPRDADAQGKLNTNATSILDTLNKAQDNGVKLELLLSPHYFPQWAVDEDPDVMIKPLPTKFIKYNIDHPVARKAISQWLDGFVPLVADHPNLLSLCLANEPVYEHSGKDPFSRPAYTAFLKERYQTIANLNQHYQAKYATFDDVPLPQKTGDDASTAQRLAYYDWVRFNQRHFADWLSWMHTRVKNHASKPLTHIKQMADIYNRSTFNRGTDPEMISSITDLAGNDCWAYPTPGGTWCYSWQVEQIWYDLLHSFGGQAVFNSENHFILDNSPAQTIAPELTHAVMWQGMLHHVAASTLWVWEEDKGVDDLKGSIYYRPGNTHGAGLAMIRGNQFANELAAFNQQKAKVALLYSYPSIYWQPDHPNTVTEIYTALTLRGQPVTFISESQLATGQRSIANDQVQLLILPHATHMTDRAWAGLQAFIDKGGKVLAIGNDCGWFDDYGQPRNTILQFLTMNLAKSTQKTAENLDAILNQYQLAAPTLIDTRTGQAAWGVEYRVLQQADQDLVSMTNFNNSTLTLSLPLEHAQPTGRDLLEETTINLQRFELAPAQSRLIRLPHQTK